MLGVFGEFSGHRLNYRKTQIYFSLTTPLPVRDLICSRLNFSPVASFEKYLGVPIINRRTRCSDYDFILEKMKARLSGWVVRSLSLVGRITLANSLGFLLREKYKVHDLLPSDIHHSSCSSLWRSLSNIWSNLLPNIAWSVGNGSRISLWNDVWVLELGPLRNHVFDPESMNSFVHIKDLVTNGSWNLDLLNSIFPPAVVPHIIAIRCPHSTDADDLCIWRWGSCHKFEVHMAYKLLQHDAWNPPDPS
ncbi:hypothetical protein V6N12_017108 [Hibiscus sabdariffa]